LVVGRAFRGLVSAETAWVVVSGVSVQGAVGSRVCEAFEPRRILGPILPPLEWLYPNEVVRDLVDHLRFLTLDGWRSENEFKKLREQHLAECERLDKECKG
jgi:hypothetical protein